MVQAFFHSAKFQVCLALAKAFVAHDDMLLKDYTAGRIVFDNYNKELSIKDDIRYSQDVSTTKGVSLYIEDNTPITYTPSRFLSSKVTKDRLTIYLANKAVQMCKREVVTATRESVQTNIEGYHPVT